MVIQVLFNAADDAVFDVDNLVGLVGHAAFMGHNNNRFMLLGVELLQELHHFH